MSNLLILMNLIYDSAYDLYDENRNDLINKVY